MELSQIVLTQPRLRPVQLPWEGKRVSNKGFQERATSNGTCAIIQRSLLKPLYAQVVKTVRRRRLVRVRHRVVFGTLAAVEQVLSACGWQINTAVVERLNLSLRQHVTAVGRRVSTLCKSEDGLRQQLVVFQVYYNMCLPHASIRQPLAEPVPTNGTGSAKLWRPWTPAMAAGLTDHVGT